MHSEPMVVTGTEPLRHDDGPLDALICFYRAFNAGDLAGLRANWVGGDAPSMSNPVGGIRRGVEDILAGYQRLFGGPARVQVELHDFTTHRDGEHCLFVGRERGGCAVGAESFELRIRTSRWFVRRGAGWRQLHHHGSMDEPQLLADYQRTIFGAPLGP